MLHALKADPLTRKSSGWLEPMCATIEEKETPAWEGSLDTTHKVEITVGADITIAQESPITDQDPTAHLVELLHGDMYGKIKHMIVQARNLCECGDRLSTHQALDNILWELEK